MRTFFCVQCLQSLAGKKRYKIGIRGYCKECFDIKQAQYNKSHPESKYNYWGGYQKEDWQLANDHLRELRKY